MPLRGAIKANIGGSIRAIIDRQEAISRYWAPDIFQCGQRTQFTFQDFSNVLKAVGIRISMDGKGRWVDNMFVECLWRSLKYEEVYLKAYETVAEARLNIGNYFRFYKYKISGCQVPAGLVKYLVERR